MRPDLLLVGLFIMNLTISGQTRKIEYTIDNVNIKPWITRQTSDYQSSYHFGNSDLESTLILKIGSDSCHAQIQSGKWIKDKGKDIWVLTNETLTNVKIMGNKFFSDKTNGEFISFLYKEKKLYGLMVYNPWSTWIFCGNDKGYEIGFAMNPNISDKK